MKPLLSATTAKNLLIGAGAYYFSWWVASPIAFVYGKLTQGIIYRGDFAGAVILPLVLRVPLALVAAGAGACVVWLVESDRPVSWAIFPALLYAVYSFLGHHWARAPVLLDQVGQAIGALFPAVTCVVGAMVALRRRTTPHATQTTPD
jgi:hypothetical protein